jgi:hypothetical protein
MTDQPSKLPRKAFGYDPSVVDQMLTDRDSMLALAERRVREAEGKVARMEEHLATREAVVAELQQQLATAPPPEPPVEEEPLTPRFMTEEVAKILAAAEESTTQILARARLSTREQILEADRLWREVQSEAARLAEWREHANAAVKAVQSAIDDARAQIESVPERIQGALGSAVDAMIRVDSQMAGFAGASTMPLVAGPSGLEAARDRVDAPGGAVGMALAAALESAPDGQPPLDMPVEAPSTEVQPFDPAMPEPAEAESGPDESDWPSLDEPLGSARDGNGDSGVLAAEASHELRHFQGTTRSGEDGHEANRIWGS